MRRLKFKLIAMPALFIFSHIKDNTGKVVDILLKNGSKFPVTLLGKAGPVFQHIFFGFKEETTKQVQFFPPDLPFSISDVMIDKLLQLLIMINKPKPIGNKFNKLFPSPVDVSSLILHLHYFQIDSIKPVLSTHIRSLSNSKFSDVVEGVVSKLDKSDYIDELIKQLEERLSRKKSENIVPLLKLSSYFQDETRVTDIHKNQNTLSVFSPLLFCEEKWLDNKNKDKLCKYLKDICKTMPTSDWIRQLTPELMETKFFKMNLANFFKKQFSRCLKLEMKKIPMDMATITTLFANFQNPEIFFYTIPITFKDKKSFFFETLLLNLAVDGKFKTVDRLLKAKTDNDSHYKLKFTMAEIAYILESPSSAFDFIARLPYCLIWTTYFVDLLDRLAVLSCKKRLYSLAANILKNCVKREYENRTDYPPTAYFKRRKRLIQIAVNNNDYAESLRFFSVFEISKKILVWGVLHAYKKYNSDTSVNKIFNKYGLHLRENSILKDVYLQINQLYRANLMDILKEIGNAAKPPKKKFSVIIDPEIRSELLHFHLERLTKHVIKHKKSEYQDQFYYFLYMNDRERAKDTLNKIRLQKRFSDDEINNFQRKFEAHFK